MNSDLPLRDAGVPCENCGCENRRPHTNRCAACGRYAPDPHYAKSPMTGRWYRVWDYDDKGDGMLVAKQKEPVDRHEVPDRYLEADDE